MNEMAATRVLVKSGYFRQQKIEDVEFELLADYKTGASGAWITVDGNSADGFPNHKLRIKLDSKEDYTVISRGEDFEGEFVEEEAKPQETDEEIIERIRKRFSILDEMTNATIDGLIRGLVVSGPPGIGKSYGIENLIDQANLGNFIAGNASEQAKYGTERGSATPISLYKLLYEYSNEGSVLVLDDSDTILYEETSLNLLKAVLDSSKKRVVSWRAESRVLENDGIPDKFEFKGSIIFITNLKLEKTRGKIGDHMKALLSRCHYIDLEIDNSHEKFLRCKQIILDGMLKNRGFDDDEEAEIIDFIKENKEGLREMSLRMVSKIADLYKISPKRWKDIASNTCMKKR